MNTRLLSFLIDDVRALIVAIHNNAELAKTQTSNYGFDTLEDFANYWEHHIEEITR